jgi:large subunit ribosomal protein L17
MRHQNAGRKFDRNGTSRRAMFRNMSANLILNERIETTDAKAKELRRVAERLITKARRLGEVAYTPGDQLTPAQRADRLAVKRQLLAYIPRFGVRVAKGGETTKVDLVEKLLIDLAKRFANRPGGYTRIIKVGLRRGDNAPLSFIELVDGPLAVEAPAEGETSANAPKAKKKKVAATAA